MTSLYQTTQDNSKYLCKHCLQYHPLTYSLGLGGLKQMFYKHGSKVIFVEKIDGLSIPVLKSKKLIKQQQQNLFGA